MSVEEKFDNFLSSINSNLEKLLDRIIHLSEKVMLKEKYCLYAILFMAIICRLLIIDFNLYSKPPVDDAAISFRFAENMADGKGFTYNEGEYVLNTTALYVFVIAFFLKLGINLYLVSNILGIFCGVSCCALTYRICALYHMPRAGLLSALFLAIDGEFVFWSVGGMETAFYTTILLYVFYSYSIQNYNLCAVLLAMLFLTRPDGALVSMIIGLHYLFYKRKIPYNYLLILLAILIPWILYTTSVYGGPLPNTLSAKRAMYLGDNWEVIMYFPDVFRSIFAFTIIGYFRMLKDWKSNSPMLVYLPAYLVVYEFLNISPMGTWYYGPPMAVFFIITSVGVASFSDILLDSKKIAKSMNFKKIMIISTVSFLLLNSGMHLLNTNHYYESENRRFESGFVDTGKWISENTPQNSTIFVGDIGYIGLYSDRYILDRVGLVSPIVVEYRKDNPDLTYTDVSLQIMQEYLPDYVVGATYYDYYLGFTNSEWFNANYEEVHRSEWGYTEHFIVTFQRKV